MVKNVCGSKLEPVNSLKQLNIVLLQTICVFPMKFAKILDEVQVAIAITDQIREVHVLQN